ncbi:unnamed protein product [Effrenium voratum]|nr:unnamed protein product [Effrenium voratum]
MCVSCHSLELGPSHLQSRLFSRCQKLAEHVGAPPVTPYTLPAVLRSSAPAALVAGINVSLLVGSWLKLWSWVCVWRRLCSHALADACPTKVWSGTSLRMRRGHTDPDLHLVSKRLPQQSREERWVRCLRRWEREGSVTDTEFSILPAGWYMDGRPLPVGNPPKPKAPGEIEAAAKALQVAQFQKEEGLNRSAPTRSSTPSTASSFSARSSGPFSDLGSEDLGYGRDAFGDGLVRPAAYETQASASGRSNSSCGGRMRSARVHGAHGLRSCRGVDSRARSARGTRPALHL